MAKRAKTSSITKTTKTTTTGTRKRPITVTTKTTTVRSNTNKPNARRVASRPAPKKGNNSGALVAIIVILAIVVLAAYLIANQQLSVAQQRGQFANQFSAMQNNNQNLTLFYLANGPNYKLDLNQSWSIQISDQDANGSVVGQMTVSWNGQSKSLDIQNGTVSAGISPTYAVTLSHPQFMALSQDVVTRNTAAALAYYSAYYLTGKINYTRVS